MQIQPTEVRPPCYDSGRGQRTQPGHNSDSKSENENVVQCNAFYSGFRLKQALCNGTRMAIEK